MDFEEKVPFWLPCRDGVTWLTLFEGTFGRVPQSGEMDSNRFFIRVSTLRMGWFRDKQKKIKRFNIAEFRERKWISV